jgi:site-specific recombinase XerD
MGDPLKVRAGGPLARFVPVFREALFRSGYASNTVAQQLRLVAHLSRWLDAHGLNVADLSPAVIDSFMGDRRGTHVNLRTRRALLPFLRFLHSSAVEWHHEPAAVLSGWERMLDRFGAYLRSERALRPTTVVNYLNQTRPFLRWRAQTAGDDFGTLAAAEVTAFLLLRAVDESRGSVRVAGTAIRALLNWMFLTGITPTSLAGAVGSIAYSSYAGLPKGLTAGEMRALTDRATTAPCGARRKVALLLVFSRLGLRSGEAAGLRLRDIHWRAGTVTVTAKGGRVEVMPLPVDVGAALAQYLTDERPAAADEHVFLRLLAPHTGMSASGISQVVTSLGTGAGIAPRIGAHRLRHTAATRVLAGGGSLIEAGQLLRHGSLTSTVIYAKVDLPALRTLVIPWPGSRATVSTIGAEPAGRS